MKKPVWIGVGAGAIGGGYVAYYLLRKEDELQVRIAPLQGANATQAESAEHVALDRTAVVVRGAALSVAF